MSSECVQCCCCCCPQYCNPYNKYARIEYDDHDEEEVSSNGMCLVPVEKIFQIQQPWQGYTTCSHSNTTPYSWQEMHPLSTYEDSVVREQPKAVPHYHTKRHFHSPSLRRVTIGSSDDLTRVATMRFSESATENEEFLSSRSRSEGFSSQYAQVPQLPMLVEEGGAHSSPSLQFSLHYDVQRRMMTVHLHQASNLPAKDRSGTSDPFVVMHLHPNKEEVFESKIVYKTLNPVFDESFEFHNLQLNDVHRQSLVFQIYDHDRFSKNDMIGGIVLPLKDVDVYGVVYRMRVDERVEKFTSKESKGDILISLAYKPEQCSLDGMILKVTNLEKQDITGLADPYVKVYLIYQESRVAKWKSSIKKNTLVAVFNEPFHFDLQKRDINHVGLEVVVMDYDRFTRNDYIGTVLLGANVQHHSGRSHWTDVVETSQQRIISRWHSIMQSQTAKAKSTQRRKASAPN